MGQAIYFYDEGLNYGAGYLFLFTTSRLNTLWS